MARKYLKDDEIKAGYWYIDKNGCKKLYLGVMQKIYGHPHFIDTSIYSPVYLYAKYDEIKKHFGANPNSIGIQDIAKAVLFRLRGQPEMYVGVKGHHKFQTECEAHPDGKIAPSVLSSPEYTFQVAFYDTFEEAKPAGQYQPDGTFIERKTW